MADDFAFNKGSKRRPRPEPTGAVKHEGHLYGHYDSRGGTTFVEGKDVRHAHLKYGTTFGYDPKRPEGSDDLKDYSMSRRQAVEAAKTDYIGPATVHSSRPIKEAQDISGFSGGRSRAVVKGTRQGYLPKKRPLDIVHVEGREKAPAGHKSPRWDDDAFGLAFIPKGKTLDIGD